jgi:PAS domain S-box-containing protein
VRPEDLGIGKLFDRVRDAVIVAEAKTERIVLWNPAAEKVFGYSIPEALEMRVEALVPGYLKAQHRTGMARYWETGRGAYIDSHTLLDLPAVKKNGEEISIELSLSPVGPVGDANGDDDDGRFVLAIVRDATERRRAEEASSRLAAIVDSSDDAILSKTLDGTITSWNGAAERIYGYSAEEVLGKPISILVPPERADEVPAILQKIRRGESVDHYETQRIKKDGTRIHVSITVSPVRDFTGNVVGASTVARDVTERKEAEEKIRRLNETLEEQVAERTAQLIDRERRLKELVGKLVAAQEEERRRVAYEVHDGPTQVAVAAHQHLQDFAYKHPPSSPVGEEKLDRALALVQQTVKETRHIIEGLRPTALDDYGLAAAVRLRIEELRKEGWQIDYEEDLGEERLSPEIEAALYRVAQEALTNVGKHARIKTAHVSLKQRSGKVCLEVEDEGCGFDPSVPKKGASGPGERVGLHSMKERVALLGGELVITSEPGTGTSLLAEIPLVPESGRTKGAEYGG